MRFLVHAATPCVDMLARALEDAQHLVEHAADLRRRARPNTHLGARLLVEQALP